jgi:hypothetical protein
VRVFVWGEGAEQLSRYSDSQRAGRSGDRIPVRSRFFAPGQTGPGAHPASHVMDTGGKVAWEWLHSPTPSGAEVTEIVELYLPALHV